VGKLIPHVPVSQTLRHRRLVDFPFATFVRGFPIVVATKDLWMFSFLRRAVRVLVSSSAPVGSSCYVFFCASIAREMKERERARPLSRVAFAGRLSD
jgi:hypothetical protein